MEKNKQLAIFSNPRNSFDDCFKNYEVGSRLYANPIIWTEKAWDILSCSPILWGEEINGFYFMNDQLVTKPDDLKDKISNRNLTLLNCSRFYSTYKEDEYEIYYLFLSRFAAKALFRFHALYEETDEIVGALTLFSMDAQESMTLLITDRKVENKFLEVENEYYRFDRRMYPTLKDLSTRNIYMGLIYRLQVALLNNEDGYVWDSIEMNEQFLRIIKEDYPNFLDVDKDICHLISPDIYKYVLKTDYSYLYTQKVATRFINNTYNYIVKNTVAGFLGLIKLHMLSKVEIRLLENTYKYMFGMQSLSLCVDNQEQIIRNSLVLFLINRAFSHVERGSVVSSFWLYRNLFYICKNTNNEYIYNLANILLQCVLYTNRNYFEIIVSKVKNEEFALSKLNFMASWKKKDNMQCLYELLSYFNANVSDQCRIEIEDKLLGRISVIGDGYDFNSIDDNLMKCVNHYFIGIEEEREFYANAIYNYIEKQIEFDPHFGYE